MVLDKKLFEEILTAQLMSRLLDTAEAEELAQDMMESVMTLVSKNSDYYVEKTVKMVMKQMGVSPNNKKIKEITTKQVEEELEYAIRTEGKYNLRRMVSDAIEKKVNGFVTQCVKAAVVEKGESITVTIKMA